MMFYLNLKGELRYSSTEIKNLTRILWKLTCIITLGYYQNNVNKFEH